MAKLSHSEVGFESPAQGADHCRDCKHFLPEGPACELVEDPIKPGDWCQKFKAGIAMPTKVYASVSEVPDYVPKAKRKQWLEVWNSQYKRQIDDGKSKDEAEQIAFASANSVAGPSSEKSAHVLRMPSGEWHFYDSMTGDEIPELEIKEASMEYEFKKIFGFQLVDKADGTHSVVGIATSERPDKDNEIADYAGTKAAIKAWSDEFVAKTTAAGQEVSLGNIRIQHDPKQIGGKVTKVMPDDGAKTIAIDTQPRDTVYDELIQTGMVTGFSIAGRYAKKWQDGEHVRYIPIISEISYVDNPCNPDAAFTHVKQDGSMELVKFSDLRRVAGKKDCKCPCKACRSGNCPAETTNKECAHYGSKEAATAFSQVGPSCSCDCTECNNGNHKDCKGNPKCLLSYDQSGKAASPEDARLMTLIERTLVATGLVKEKKTKRKGGKDLSPKDFAYVGDPDDPSTWKLPIHDEAHCRNALARFNQTHGIPASEKAKVKAKIIAACKRFGIEVSEDTGKAVQTAMTVVLAEVMGTEADAKAAVANVFKIAALDNPEARCAKGMYTVSQMAQILEGLQYLVASTAYERDYEGDDSSVPDDLRSALEDLIPIFVAMAQEESSELLGEAREKAANGGQGGKSMSETKDADLLKAAKEKAAEIWKKAKSLFHKMGKSHAALSKCMTKAAEHHTDHAETAADIAEAHAKKTTQDEIAKLIKTDDFQKMSPADKVIARIELMEKLEKTSGHAKAFGSMAKAHGQLAKTTARAAEHYDDLEKAAVAVGDEEEAIDMQTRAKDDEEAEPGGSSEKTAEGTNKELIELMRKELFTPLEARLKTVEDNQAAMKKDVDAAMTKLEPGPGEAAKGAGAQGSRLVADRNAGPGNKEGAESKVGSRLKQSPSDNSATKSVGVFQ